MTGGFWSTTAQPSPTSHMRISSELNQLLSLKKQRRFGRSRQGSHIPALPFCHLTLTASKTKTSCISSLNTLGEHVIARRRERQLLQREVAHEIGVSEETINHWETGKTEPEVKYWPKIMEFLRYCPYREAKTFGDLLFLHRTHRGLSHRELAKIIGCDPGSLSRWETGERSPRTRVKRLLINYFNLDKLDSH